MKILSCNIRYFGAADGENSWAYRKDICTEVIRSQLPDVICFQEMWAEQFIELRAAFPEFDHFAMVDEPSGRHPMNAIFFRDGAFTRISAGGYWLSESPHVPGSKSWDSDCIRLANWLRLEPKASKNEFRVINTHLDHVGQTARERQAQLIVQDASAYPEAYVQILTGDMNCDAGNKAIQIFKAGGWHDTYGTQHGTENPGHTYHGFLGSSFPSNIGKMDWIFFKGDAQVRDAQIIKEARNGRFPSDHYFVSAEIALGDG